MRLVIESAAESRDGVSIERHTPMTNTELTLDQLQTINGGAAFMKLGDIRGEYRRVILPDYRRAYSTPRHRIGGSSGPGGTSF